MKHEKLGELGGWWEVLFKVRQIAGVALVPITIALATVIVVPWCRSIEQRLVEIQNEAHDYDTRIIRLEQFAAQGDRFTATQAAAMKLELQNQWLKEISEIRRQIDMLPQTLQIPPQWWEDYVRQEFERVNKRLDAHEQQK